MGQPAIATTRASAEAADPASAVATTMAVNDKKTFWQRHRMPIILGLIAVSLYAGSIFWMVYARGQIG